MGVVFGSDEARQAWAADSAPENERRPVLLRWRVDYSYRAKGMMIVEAYSYDEAFNAAYDIIECLHLDKMYMEVMLAREIEEVDNAK